MKLFTNKVFLNTFNHGDEKAFIRVYDFFVPKIFRFVYYKAKQDKVLAEDITQRVFMKTWEYIVSDKRNIDNIQAFLYRIARNMVIDRYRAHHKETLELNDELIETTEHSPRWIEKIDAKISVELLERTLDKISEQYKEVIIMRYIEEFEIDEIASILEKDKNSIYVLIHRALKALRARLTSNT